jgi:two-component system, LuxR family, response regulator FixJ
VTRGQGDEERVSDQRSMITHLNPTIFVVDDDESVRRALFYLLKSAGYETETYASAEEFLTRERYDGVGCIILDVRMPGLSGIDLQEELLRSGYGSMPIIFLTGHGQLDMGIKAMKKGAVDFLIKPCDDEQLLETLRGAIEQSLQARTGFEETQEIRRRIEDLTPREHEILRYVIAGMLNKQIGGKLAIAEATVKIHRGRIMEKLRATSVADLVRMAGKAGIEPPVKSGNR